MSFSLRFLLFFVLVFGFTGLSAHSDFWVVKKFGNVTVRIETGYRYEEINKVAIIGQLAEKLALELKYTKPVFLDFNHFYVGDCVTDYFVSYDNGDIEEPYESGRGTLYTKSVLVIRQNGRFFDPLSTLKLVKYAIQNENLVRTSQKKISYNQKYCQWRVNTIDPVSIKEVLSQANDDIIQRIISSRIERPEENFHWGISYYYENNKPHIFWKDYKKEERVELSLDNIYLFRTFYKYAVVFDTDSSFYVIQHYKSTPSAKHIVLNAEIPFEPYDIQHLGGDKISFHFKDNSKDLKKFLYRDRVLLYLAEKDSLIQDLDYLIEKQSR